MIKHFPKCPVCRSEANYTVGPSEIMVTCNSCKAKFSSDEFRDPRKDLTGLSLLTPPSVLVEESLIRIFKTMRYEMHPIDFWKGIKPDESELMQRLMEYRKKMASVSQMGAASLRLAGSPPTENVGD